MKRHSLILLVSFLILFLLGGCLQQQQESAMTEQEIAKVKEEVQQTWNKFAEIWMTSDPAATSDWYTEDCLNMPDDLATMEGNAAVKGAFTGMFANIENKKITYTTLEVDVCGDKIFELGLLEHTLVPKGGTELTIYARYYCVWQRQADGSLKIHRYLFNSLPQTEDAMKIFK